MTDIYETLALAFRITEGVLYHYVDGIPAAMQGGLMSTFSLMSRDAFERLPADFTSFDGLRLALMITGVER